MEMNYLFFMYSECFLFLLQKIRVPVLIAPVLSTILILPSCELINPDEEIPSYIKIDTITLTTTYAVEGSASHKITDAWVYVDDQLVGVYELPALIPVLKNGTSKITVLAGIKMNGIAATRVPYPFFRSYEITTELFTDSIIILQPSVKYHTNVTFAWKEDFENPGFTLEPTAISDTTINRITDIDHVFEGNACGLFALSSQQDFCECKTINTYELPKGGSYVFLELNYKCNNRFRIGIFVNEPGGLVTQVPQTIVINPSENWNKIYVNLTKEVSLFANAINHNIYFGVLPDAGVAEPKVYLDNIKLIW